MDEGSETTGQAAQISPGWYEDPEGDRRLRYWDGERWTGKTKAQPLSGLPEERPHGPVNRLAVAAFICATVAVPVTSIPAIVLGFLALDEIDDSSGTQRGEGLARWAIILGLMALALTVVSLVLYLESV